MGNSRCGSNLAAQADTAHRIDPCPDRRRGAARRFAVGVNDLSIMAGGDEVGLQLLAVGPQLAELQPVVAHHAWIRRAAGEILVGEVIDDAVEIALEIQRVKRNVEPVGDAAGVAGIDGAATALLVVGASSSAPWTPVRMNRPMTS